MEMCKNIPAARGTGTEEWCVDPGKEEYGLKSDGECGFQSAKSRISTFKPRFRCIFFREPHTFESTRIPEEKARRKWERSGLK